MTLSPAVTRRLHTGVTYIAVSLSRLALELEQLELEGHDGTKQRAYDMIQEASKLLPLFQSHTEAVFEGIADEPPAQAGFRSLPTDVQNKILCLASTDVATSRQLRSVCHAFAAQACLTERSRTSLDISCAQNACRLPYLPRLCSIACPKYLSDTPLQRYLHSILCSHLGTWPNFTSLEFQGGLAAHFLNRLHLAPQLLQLRFQGTLPDAAEGADPLHGVWQLTQLRALHLDFSFPTISVAVQQLSHLQLLTRLQYCVPINEDDDSASPAELAFANALGGLSSLRELELHSWPCTAESAGLAPWQALMQSVCKLTQLSLLKFEEWDLVPNSSAAYMPALASTLQSLTSLRHLELHGYTDWEHGHVDAAGFAAGCALVAAIGTLTRLHSLTLYHLRAVDARECCRHLAPLVHLQHLQLEGLRDREPAAHAGDAQDAAPPAGQTNASRFVHLLSRMTRLQTLALCDMTFGGRDALRVFSSAIPALAGLRMLNVRGNGLEAAPLMVLALSWRQLPTLQVICRCSEEVTDDLNRVSGNVVFR